MKCQSLKQAWSWFVSDFLIGPRQQTKKQREPCLHSCWIDFSADVCLQREQYHELDLTFSTRLLSRYLRPQKKPKLPLKQRRDSGFQENLSRLKVWLQINH